MEKSDNKTKFVPRKLGSGFMLVQSPSADVSFWRRFPHPWFFSSQLNKLRAGAWLILGLQCPVIYYKVT